MKIMKEWYNLSLFHTNSSKDNIHYFFLRKKGLKMF